MMPALEVELTKRTMTRSFREDVRVFIASHMSGEKPSVDRIARDLRLSPRTLQRRLGAEGTTYQIELDLVRRATARRLLSDTDLDAVEVAFFLGFDEPNSFVRAFRGWEGTTPIRWRESAASI